MALFPLPPMNAEGIVLYGFMGLGLAVGFALAVPLGMRVQDSLTGGTSTQ